MSILELFRTFILDVRQMVGFCTVCALRNALRNSRNHAMTSYIAVCRVLCVRIVSHSFRQFYEVNEKADRVSISDIVFQITVRSFYITFM